MVDTQPEVPISFLHRHTDSHPEYQKHLHRGPVLSIWLVFPQMQSRRRSPANVQTLEESEGKHLANKSKCKPSLGSPHTTTHVCNGVFGSWQQVSESLEILVGYEHNFVSVQGLN